MTQNKPAPVPLQDRLLEARESMHERFFAAFEKANEAFTPSSLATEISAMLTKERREIVLKLLGFENSWGKLEIDRCNGRDKESIVGRYLRDQAEPIVTAWMEKEIRPIFEAKARERLANNAVRKAVERDFVERFSYHLRANINREAERLAKEHAAAFSAQVSQTMSMATPE
jgi:hypothetical protein